MQDVLSNLYAKRILLGIATSAPVACAKLCRFASFSTNFAGARSRGTTAA